MRLGKIRNAIQRFFHRDHVCVATWKSVVGDGRLLSSSYASVPWLRSGFLLGISHLSSGAFVICRALIWIFHFPFVSFPIWRFDNSASSSSSSSSSFANIRPVSCFSLVFQQYLWSGLMVPTGSSLIVGHCTEEENGERTKQQLPGGRSVI